LVNKTGPFPACSASSAPRGQPGGKETGQKVSHYIEPEQGDRSKNRRDDGFDSTGPPNFPTPHL
jgi:hypothetical protein